MTETDTTTTIRERVRAPFARRPVWTVGAIVAVIHLAVATRYGWHQDEFYYVICGRHLAFGYVDQPPLTPILAALAASLPGGVLPLRILAIAAQVGCIVLTGVLAAELGGGRRAQTLAAAAIAATPVFVGASLLFGTTVVDQFVWIAMFVLVARALRLRTTSAWLAAGVVAGVGLENKDTVAVLLAGILLGMFLYHRDVLRTKGFWLAAAVAVLIAVPNLVWDAQHGWINLQMAHRLGQEQGGILGSLVQLPLLALLPLIVLYIAGIRWLTARVGREHRWLLVVAAAAVVIFVLGSGKFYYPAPALAGLFAAGAVRIEAAWTAGSTRRWTTGVAISAVVALVIGLPVLPPKAATALRAVNDNVMQTYGWTDFTDQVGEAAASLPAGTPIFAVDYADAGAITILDPSLAARNPVYSGHNNYGLWGPPAGTPGTALCVGQFDVGDLRRSWSRVTKIAPITLPDGIVDDQTAAHGAIYLCQDPRGTWAQLWPGLRHLD